MAQEREEMQKIINLQRLTSFKNRGNIEWRIKNIEKLEKILTDNFLELVENFHELKKCKFEVNIETELSIIDIHDGLANLKKWTNKKYLSKAFANTLDSVYILPEPLGCCLVITPWNYPIYIVFRNVIEHFLAGNCVILKLSEQIPIMSAYMKKLIENEFDSSVIKVYCGEVKQSEMLTSLNFDHISFTGSSQVGKLVYQKAAENLTPVLLELGGKNGVYVDDHYDIAMAARRIIWGKCLNAGQVCISPDYVLCSSRIMNLLKTEMEKYITQFYTDDVKSSADYGRILNEKFFDKIINKIKKSNLDVPECDRESLYIKPTVYANVSPDSEIMKEEIFAPVLPLIECNSFTEAIEFINKIPKPLAIYLFTYNDEIKNSFLLKTSSGGFCLNDVIMQNSVNNLPFGGVGASGIGRYGGYSGFKQFSNMRSVLERCSLFHQVREPPYTDKSIKILNWLMRKPRKGVLNWIKSWNM